MIPWQCQMSLSLSAATALSEFAESDDLNSLGRMGDTFLLSALCSTACGPGQKISVLWFNHCAVLCLVTLSCLTLCDPVGGSLPGSSVHGDSSDKHTGVGCHALLQGIFLTQGLNLGLLNCRQILYHLSHQGIP